MRYIVTYPVVDKPEPVLLKFETARQVFEWMQSQVDKYDGLPVNMQVFEQVLVTQKGGG